MMDINRSPYLDSIVICINLTYNRGVLGVAKRNSYTQSARTMALRITAPKFKKNI